MRFNKYMIILFLLINTVGCGAGINQEKKKEVENYIISNLPSEVKDIFEYDEAETGMKYKDDEFYFIYGLDYDGNPATNIRYRGILYSKRLKEYKYPEGLEIGLRNLSATPAELYNIAGNYEGLMMQIEIDSMAENKAKELFGAKCNLMNDGMTTNHMYNTIIKKTGQNISFDKKSGYYKTVVNVFCDDLEKIDESEYKDKTYKLAKYIYENMNYVTSLQIYVRDNKYFENYDLVYRSIYPPFREREDIVGILKKIKHKEKINEEEKVKLVEVFGKGMLDEEIENFIMFNIDFGEKKDIPIKLKQVKRYMELKNGNMIYITKEELEK